jgi:hypothetical protein
LGQSSLNEVDEKCRKKGIVIAVDQGKRNSLTHPQPLGLIIEYEDSILIGYEIDKLLR